MLYYKLIKVEINALSYSLSRSFVAELPFLRFNFKKFLDVGTEKILPSGCL
jgi:hypothetical protein